MARGKKRALTVALAVSASILSAPLAAPMSAGAALVDTSDWPTWLLGSDIAVNPPAPAPGSSTPPPVARGYVITADALPKFDITRTDAAQAELREFANRLATNHGVNIDTARYRVYAMPSIRAASDAEAAGRTVRAVLALRSLLAESASSNGVGIGPIDLIYYPAPDDIAPSLFSLVDAIIDLQPTIDPQPTIDEALAFVDALRPLVDQAVIATWTLAWQLVADVQAIIDGLPTSDELVQMILDATAPLITTVEQLKQYALDAIGALDVLGTIGELLDQVPTVDPYAVLAQVQSLIDSLGPLPTVDPAALVAQIVAVIESVDVDAILTDAGLPTISEASEDPAHAAPAGTDLVTDPVEDYVTDLAILPVGASVNYLGAAWEDAMVMVTTALETTPLAPVPGTLAAVPVPASHSEWDPQTANCPSRKQNSTAWFDTCDQWAHLARDADPTRGTWALSQWGSAKSKNVYELKRFENHSRRTKGSADQKWLDWSPRATSDAGNCSSETIGVNVNAAYWERSESHCDWWVIDKRNPEVYFTNEWQGTAYKVIRAVSANHAFSVPNGTYPICNVRYDYYARYKW